MFGAVDLGRDGYWKIGDAGLGGGVSSSSDESISCLTGLNILGDFGFEGPKKAGDFGLV